MGITIKVIMFKMPFETKHFNKNQKVWIQRTTGDFAVKVTGKFRGKGKYISAWVRWDQADKEKYASPVFIETDVNLKFMSRHNLKSFDKKPTSWT